MAGSNISLEELSDLRGFGAVREDTLQTQALGVITPVIVCHSCT